MKKLFNLVLVLVCGIFVLPSMVNAQEVTVCSSDCTYDSLSNALTNIAENDTIKLNEDITLTTKVVVSKNVTIDLNGHDITMNGDQYVIEFNKVGGEFTLTDSSATAGSVTNSTNRGILVTNGELTLDKITVESLDRTIQINPVTNDDTSKASVIMNGGKVVSTKTDSSARTIKLWGNNVGNNASFTLNDGEVIASIASKNSAAIDMANIAPNDAYGATVTINGGKITGYNGVRVNGSGEKGMAILTMNGGTIEAASSGILQNTTDGTENTEIYIYGGTILAHDMQGSAQVGGDAVAIHHGQTGVLVIGNSSTGPVITGETAIAIKEGTITVNSGEITATGAYRDPASARNDGTDDTGAAISITSNDEYSDGVSLVVNGGTITSENGIKWNTCC